MHCSNPCATLTATVQVVKLRLVPSSWSTAQAVEAARCATQLCAKLVMLKSLPCGILGHESLGPISHPPRDTPHRQPHITANAAAALGLVVTHQNESGCACNPACAVCSYVSYLAPLMVPMAFLAVSRQSLIASTRPQQPTDKLLSHHGQAVSDDGGRGVQYDTVQQNGVRRISTNATLVVTMDACKYMHRCHHS